MGLVLIGTSLFTRGDEGSGDCVELGPVGTSLFMEGGGGPKGTSLFTRGDKGTKHCVELGHRNKSLHGRR